MSELVKVVLTKDTPSPWISPVDMLKSVCIIGPGGNGGSDANGGAGGQGGGCVNLTDFYVGAGNPVDFSIALGGSEQPTTFAGYSAAAGANASGAYPNSYGGNGGGGGHGQNGQGGGGGGAAGPNGSGAAGQDASIGGGGGMSGGGEAGEGGMGWGYDRNGKLIGGGGGGGTPETSPGMNDTVSPGVGADGGAVVEYEPPAEEEESSVSC